MIKFICFLLFYQLLIDHIEAFISSPNNILKSTAQCPLSLPEDQIRGNTSLNIFFRKNSNDHDKKSIAEDKIIIRSPDDERSSSRSWRFFKKSPKKRTAIRSTYVDTTAMLDNTNQIRPRTKEKKTGCRIIEHHALAFFQRRSVHLLNLKIDADPYTNSFSRLIRGKIGKLNVNFDRIALPRIKISGGGQFRLPYGATFSLLSIPSFIQNSFNIKRFRSDFELEANQVIFTEDDVKESFWIRKGVELLLNRILKAIVVRTMGGVAVVKSVVKTVEILDNGKISCTGEAISKVGKPIPFEVITGLRTSNCGQILHFPGIEMHLFPIRDIIPESPPILNIPLHKFFPVDLDIGKNANLKVRVDGKRRRLHVSLWALVTPFKLDRDRVKSSGGERDYEKNAKFYCDVGRWVTKIGRFAE